MTGLIGISCILVLLAVSTITEAQFAVGFSPAVGMNHLGVRPDRGEQGQSTCVDWRSPNTYDKMIAPYAQRMCNQFSPMQNGGANAMPGFAFGYTPFNAAPVYGYNPGFNNGYANGFGGMNYGGYGGGFGAPYYRPY